MKSKYLSIFLLAITGTLILSSCNSQSSNPTTEISITLGNEDVALHLGETYQIDYKVTGTKQEPTFVSSDTTIATVDDTGFVSTLNVGTVNITVAIGKISKICKITVNDSDYVPYISFEDLVDNEVKLTVGSEFTLNSTLHFGGELVSASFTYEVNNNTVASIDENGKITANCVGFSEITVKTSYLIWDEIFATVNVEVVDNVEIRLSKNKVYLSNGKTIGGITSDTISVLGVYKNGVLEKDATYSFESENPSVATVNDSGLINAISVGETEIRVIYGEYYGVCEVYVSKMKLQTPTNITLKDNLISWNKVLGADYYLITDGSNSFSTTQTSFDIRNNGYFGEVGLRIQACSNNEQIDSSEYSFKQFKFESVQCTKALLDLHTYEADSIDGIFGDDFSNDGDIYYTQVSRKELTKDYGFGFKKVYYTSSAYNGFGTSWCQKPLIPMGEAYKYYDNTISFWAYADEETTFYYSNFDSWWTRTLLSEKTIPAKQWTKVSFTITKADLIYITLLSANKNFYFMDFRISSPLYETKDYSNLNDLIKTNLIQKIDNLPSKENLSPFDGQKIDLCLSIYNMLPESHKSEVTNYNKLASLKQEYSKTYVTLFSMATMNGLSEFSSIYAHNANHSIVTDPTYGKVLKQHAIRGGTNIHGVIEYDLNLGDLSDCDFVHMLVYNGSNVNKSFMGSFGGKINATYATLKAKQWSEVIIPVADFLKGYEFSTGVHGCFGVINIEKDVDYYYTQIYATKASASIADLIAKIDYLATLDPTNPFTGSLLSECLTTYNNLASHYKSLVTNYSLLTKFAADYEQRYKVLLDMNNSVYGIKGDSFYGCNSTLSYGCDEVYGKYFAGTTYNGGTNKHACWNMLDVKKESLSDYAFVYFAVYNGGKNTKRLIMQIDGKLNIANSDTMQIPSLPAKEWTLIKIPVSQYAKFDRFGIENCENNTEYKYSIFYATKGSYETAEINKQIAEYSLTTDLQYLDIVKLNRIKATYESFDENTKTFVQGYDKIETLITNYHNKFATLYDMKSHAINDKFYINVNRITGAFGIGYDSVYGDYVSVTTSGHGSSPAHSINLALKESGWEAIRLAGGTPTEASAIAYNSVIKQVLGNCKKVYVPVYNPTSSSITFKLEINYNHDETICSLAPNSWTLVEFTPDKIVNSSWLVFDFGTSDPAIGTTIKVGAIRGLK